MAIISRRCSTVLITLLALFLLGTIIVLSTVRAYYSIDSTAYILPEELGTWDQIKLGINPDAVLAAQWDHAAAAAVTAVTYTAEAASANSAIAVSPEASAAAASSPSSSSSSSSASSSFSSSSPPPSGSGSNRKDGAPRASSSWPSSSSSSPSSSSSSSSSSSQPGPIIPQYNHHDNTVRPWNMTSPPERIPRIIHQTWKDSTLPPQWQVLKDDEYMLWTDAESRTFIEKHYNWFLPVFDAYPYPIQRADAIRYFVLHHYGGIYMDLDIGCLRRFDPLLRFELILPKTIPVGVSNDLMLAKKGHPFMELVIHNLVAFNHQYLTNYPTVMFSTGPMFLSASYGMFVSKHGPAQQSSSQLPEAGFSGVRVLPKSLYGKNAKPGEAPDAFFRHLYGSSWHSNDAGFLIFLRDHGTLLMIVGFYIVAYGTLRTLLPRHWKGRARSQRGWLNSVLGGASGPGGGGGGSGSGSGSGAGSIGSGGGSHGRRGAGAGAGGVGLSLGAPGSAPSGSGAVSRFFPFRKRGRWIALRTSDPDALDSDSAQSGVGSAASAPSAAGGRRANPGGVASVRWKRSDDLEFV
ncbi:hypothetical protein OC834_006789 [Tilletia horrida]|nr:hypothetical protein OC834_006789 [Tilletia horrida]